MSIIQNSDKWNSLEEIIGIKIAQIFVKKFIKKTSEKISYPNTPAFNACFTFWLV